MYLISSPRAATIKRLITPDLRSCDLFPSISARDLKSLNKERTVRGGGGKINFCVDLQVIATSPKSPHFFNSALILALQVKYEFHIYDDFPVAS